MTRTHVTKTLDMASFHKVALAGRVFSVGEGHLDMVMP